MADSPEETKSKILTSAKAEFLEKGFTKAAGSTHENFLEKIAAIFIGNIQEFFHFGFMHLLGLPCNDYLRGLL